MAAIPLAYGGWRMIDRAEASRLAREWARRELGSEDPGFREFEAGYVVWDRPPSTPGPPPTDSAAAPPGVGTPSGEAGQPPPRVGAARGVLDRDTGHWSRWPSLPIDEVIRLYLAYRAGSTRFPEDVRTMLRLAGWVPGRDGAALLRTWCRRHQIDDAVLFPVARAVAADFGGLTIAGYRFTPTPDDHVPPAHPDLADRLGMRVWQIAVGDSRMLVVDESGAVHRRDHSGDAPYAPTVDDALVRLVRREDE
ncbi:SUKH-3 domain-containing protein [Plantactinospora sp. ZYX-F-223]|uniref:SUKH-3 domain-containing protein n=1 Tax=Plantactinospora sp. ZYX-F-223 TaxID=3144103 RepID=UPI0031FBEBC3